MVKSNTAMIFNKIKDLEIETECEDFKFFEDRGPDNFFFLKYFIQLIILS